MQVYTYSEARQRFNEVLNIAREEEVIIKRRDGETFTIVFKKTPKSPFDIPGLKTKATSETPPAERVASGSPPEGGVLIGKAPLELYIIYSKSSSLCC